MTIREIPQAFCIFENISKSLPSEKRWNILGNVFLICNYESIKLLCKISWKEASKNVSFFVFL